jgi:hypothetical protein
MRARVLAVLLMAAGAAFGGDADFDRIVKAIESHYGTHRLHIPLMGVASLLVSVARPEGATGFKLAVFEDLKSSPEYGEWKERDRFMDTVFIGEMHPLVRVHSQRGGNATYIFAEPSGKSTRVLIATFERDEATVVEVKVNMSTLLKSIEEPEAAGRTLGGSRVAAQ